MSPAEVFSPEPLWNYEVGCKTSVYESWGFFLPGTYLDSNIQIGIPGADYRLKLSHLSKAFSPILARAKFPPPN